MPAAEKIKKFYEIAREGGWVNCRILVNEAKVLEGWSNVHDGPVLTFTDRCEELPTEVLGAIAEVGLSPATYEHKKDAYVEGHCHIQFEGREPTAEELFLPNLRKWAEHLGYAVVDIPEEVSPLGWGIYGETLNDAMQAMQSFNSELGGVVASWQFTHYEEGRAAYILSLHAIAMINVTEPPEEEPPEKMLLKCIFPRLLGGMIAPRLELGPLPRISCILKR